MKWGEHVFLLWVRLFWALFAVKNSFAPFPLRIALWVALALFSFHSFASAQTDASTLELGKPVERELKGEETHGYRIELLSGQFLRVKTEQLAGNVVVGVVDPDGKVRAEVDTPTSRFPEWLSFMADSAGTYRIEVRASARGVSAKYRIKLTDLRMGSDDEHHFAASQRLLGEAILIFQDKGNDAFARARVKIDEAAATCALIAGDQRLKADGLLEIAKVFRSQGARELSLTFYDRAASVFENAGFKYETLTTVAGSALMAPSTMDYLRRFEKAHAIAKNMGDRRLEVSSLTQMGNAYYWMGDLSRSLQIFRQGLSIAEENGYHGNVGQIYGVMGQVYSTLSDFPSAMESNRKALEVYRSNGYPNEKGWLTLDVGRIYFSLGDYRIALEKFETALAELERVGDPIISAFAMEFIGDVYSKRGEYNKALEYYAKPESILRITNPNARYSSYSKIAIVYRMLGRYDEAINAMQKPIEGCQAPEAKAVCADLFVIMSNIYLDQGNLPKALEYADKAISLAVSIGYANPIWSAQMLSGKARLGLGDVAEGRRLLEQSTAEIEKLRKRLINDTNSRQQFFEDKSVPAKMLIDLMVADSDSAKAFSLAEQIKARTLLDVLQTSRLDVSKALTPKEKQAERTVRNEIASLNSQISNETEASILQLLQAQLEKKRIEFEDLQTTLYALHPELKIQRGEIKPISFEESASLMSDARSAIAEFVVTETKTFLFVITKDAANKPSLKVFTLSIREKELAKRIEAYRERLADGDLDFQRPSRELYELLLEPAAAQLAAKTNIVLVPDGPLWNLPFQALLDKKGKYLVETSVISYAPSLTALREMSKKAETRKSTPEAEFIAFGNPIVAKDTSERIQRVFMNEKHEPLPEAERLVNALGKMYGPGRSKVLIGNEAREEVAKSEAPKYRIVQFATHGILNNVSPMYSHLVLSQDAKNPNEDGLLEAWELKDLNINADMVILSACDTARGKISGGEGMVGMTWASFIAGAPTTVASQWKVESSSTTEFMLEFHRQLLANNRISKAAAMRRAALKLLRSPKYKHPSYWSAWVLVGDGS